MKAISYFLHARSLPPGLLPPPFPRPSPAGPQHWQAPDNVGPGDSPRPGTFWGSGPPPRLTGLGWRWADHNQNLEIKKASRNLPEAPFFHGGPCFLHQANYLGETPTPKLDLSRLMLGQLSHFLAPRGAGPLPVRSEFLLSRPGPGRPPRSP